MIRHPNGDACDTEGVGEIEGVWGLVRLLRSTRAFCAIAELRVGLGRVVRWFHNASPLPSNPFAVSLQPSCTR